MKLFLETLNRKKLSVDVEPNDTVESLKAKFKTRWATIILPIMTVNGQKLEDHQTINDLKIDASQTLVYQTIICNFKK